MSSDRERAAAGAAHEVVVSTRGLGKCYHVYRRPQDRLRQLIARGGKRYYTEFWALRDVDLEVRRGETLGIVGHNGAGKSTLLQLIAGTLKPTTGSAVVSGRVTALLELGSGFHHQFTGRENVYVAGALLGLSREEMEERMPRIEAFAEIGEFLDRPVKTYSQGMFARLSFSVYANLDPDVFIVDEALAVGDAKFRHRCMYRFKQMQDQGVAVVYVSHDAAPMKHLCDRVAWIDKGCLRRVGEPGPVVDEYLNHLFFDRRVEGANGAVEQVRGDDDLGTRRALMVGARLLDATGASTDHVTGGDEVTLHVGLRNEQLPDNCSPLLIGFSIATVQGFAVTGTNNVQNDVVIPAPGRGATVATRYCFRMPRLVTGSYSITLTAMRPVADGDAELLHIVPNALTFEVSAPRRVFGLLGIDCRIEVDPPGDQSSR